MAILSTLKLLTRVGSHTKVPVRYGGHGPQLRIQPSKFIWSKFKDYLHFYILLAAVPLTLITAYANIFIGDAELTEIPEGYTPHHWEYYKHPVTRFFAKHLLYDKAIDYETLVSKFNDESERAIIHAVEKKIRLMQLNDADFVNGGTAPNRVSEYHIADNRYASEWHNTEHFRYFGVENRGDDE